MDPALHAHLRRAAVPRLGGAPGNLVVVQEVRRPAEFEFATRRAFAEGAKRAREGTRVRVVDVAVHHVRHHVAALFATRRVRSRAHAVEISAARAEQRLHRRAIEREFFGGGGGVLRDRFAPLGDGGHRGAARG